MLCDRADEALRQRVADLPAQLKSDASNAVARVIAQPPLSSRKWHPARNSPPPSRVL
jgi:hypothetical protein